MLTMRPPPAARMCGTARRASRIGATTIVSRTRRASSSLTSSTAPVAGWPALLTSPQGRRVSMARAHAWGSVTSRSTVSTSTPARAAASATRLAFSRERTLPTERKPRRASSTTVARPLPELAPVVSTVRVIVRGSIRPACRPWRRCRSHACRPPCNLPIRRLMRTTPEQDAEIAAARSARNETRRPTVSALEELLYEVLPVLDHGFVRVIDYMGDDAAIVQAARVSYGKGTRRVNEDRGLIRYLMRHHHTTPFEMCELKLHCKLPIFVARQWIRHRTANVNEYSGRYSILDREFYLPPADALCVQSTGNRQG